MERTCRWLPLSTCALLIGCAIERARPEPRPLRAAGRPASPPWRPAPPAARSAAGAEPGGTWAWTAGGRAVAAQDPASRTPDPQGPAWGEGEAVSWVVPAVEIVAFEFLLNQYDRHFAEDDELYESDWDTFTDNLQSGWVTDRDPFGVNQLGHPYSGAIYHQFARSTGHGYWVALGFAFAGSALWETAGEVTRPSLNDQITTGIGGTFLGEAFFRGASRILEDANTSDLGRFGAVLLSPPLAFNRWAFDRFDGLEPSGGPPVLMRLGAGLRSNTFVADSDRSNTEEREDAAGEFAMEYGLPGRASYAYEQPFDYFQLEVAGMTDPDNHVAHLRARGLLVGSGYGGGAVDGVYGLYGIYDYLSPGIFRVANTALAFGTTAQLRLSDDVALQGTALLGGGFGAAGTVADDLDDRDYRYGGIPQAVLDWRLVLGDVAMVESAVREYLVIGVADDEDYGSENVFQADVAVTLRVAGAHALRAEYVASVRDTDFNSAPDERQSVGTLLFSYVYLGASRWGVVR